MFRNNTNPCPHPQPNSYQYTGYTPKTPADFHSSTRPLHNDQTNENSALTIQHTGTHVWLTARKMSILVFALALLFFAVSLSISVFNLECKLGLCLKLDHSSPADSATRFTNFDFIAPLNYIWAAFSVSVLGIAIAALYFILLGLQKRGINQLLADFAAIIRLGLRAFFLAQLKYYAVATLAFFIFVGLLHSWRSAGCFFFGLVVSTIVQYAVNAIVARGVPKTTVGAQYSIQACLETALRNGAIVAVVVLSLAVGGISSSYLIFQDIRALEGYVLGVSVVSLFSRMCTGFYKGVSTIEEDYGSETVAFGARNPSFAANTVGQLASNCASVATDVLASHSIAVVATAILGASFPFFYNNPYAICVFNHLSIDRTCISYESPTVKTSLAASICRRDSFFMGYNSLKVEESNSLFVALPFILAFTGILTTGASCFFWFLIPNGARAGNNGQLSDASGSESKLKFLRSMKRRHLFYIVASLVMSLACASAVCWVLFGGHSAFAVATSQQLQMYELQPLSKDNGATRCRPLEAQEGTGKTGLPVLRLTSGPYRPSDSLGRQIPPTAQVPWRLFTCFLLGTVVGVPIGILSAYFSSPNSTLLGKLGLGGDTGGGDLIIEGLGISMLAAVVPAAMVGAVIGIAHNLFGAYGIGIAAVGLVCSVGTALTFQMLGPIADAARDESQVLLFRGNTDADIELVSAFGMSTYSFGRGIISASTFLSLMVLVAVFGEDAGFFPSPRQLVGSPTIRPSRHITDYIHVSVMDVYVLASSMLGILVPWLFAAILLISGQYVSHTLRDYVEKLQLSSRDIMARHVPGLRSRYLRFMQLCSSIGVTETVLPGILAVITPLIIGFGFGRQALLGFVIAVLASSYMLSVTVCSLTGVFESVRNKVSLLLFSEQVDVTRVGQGFGKGLAYCCAPALNALPAVVSTFGVVAVQKMSLRLHRGWIGIILLVVTIISTALGTFLIRRKREKIANEGTDNGRYERMEEEPPAVLDPTYVSPFYEAGPRVELNEVVASSGLRRFEHMEAVGFSDSDNDSFGEWYPVYNPRDSEEGTIVGVGTTNGPSGEFTVTMQEVDCVRISH